MQKNAIILAAGKSNRFAPFTYERPKGLFCVKGEILIERQIEQLKEAGVEDIYIVIGYMKEKFFYLEQKYGVHLLVNNYFGSKGNIYSLYVARENLGNTFICCADHYFIKNPFTCENEKNESYRACAYLDGKFREFAVSVSDANVITDVEVGGEDSLAMIGHAYINEQFGQKYRELLEYEINDFGIAQMFWEEFFKKHIKELTFYKREFSIADVLEFETIDDLREFDSEFLLNIDSEIITNICSVLKCNANDITDITVINAGLTNVSFSFAISAEKYVYRHPGGTAGNLVDRDAECFAQMKAGELGIDASVIYIDRAGWKISKLIKNARNCDLRDDHQLNVALEYIRKLHSIPMEKEVKIFDNIAEGMKLMRIASATKGHLEKEFSEIIGKVMRLYDYLKQDAEELGYELVLCHNDTYEPNYLMDDEGRIYLIDWEYAGFNYAANDIGSILCRGDWSDEQIERFLRSYMGRKLNEREHRFFYAFLPISGFYWFCWGLYKGSVGDDDSFFFLPAYRSIIRFVDKGLASYENKGDNEWF